MKHLVDIDEEALRRAQAQLSTTTIKDTVNRALRTVSEERTADVERSLDVLARIPLEPREDAWR